MKVVVTLSIDVDPADWADVYGIEKADVRQDIKEYVRNQVQQSPGICDADATVTIR